MAALTATPEQLNKFYTYISNANNQALPASSRFAVDVSKLEPNLTGYKKYAPKGGVNSSRSTKYPVPGLPWLFTNTAAGADLALTALANYEPNARTYIGQWRALHPVDTVRVKGVKGAKKARKVTTASKRKVGSKSYYGKVFPGGAAGPLSPREGLIVSPRGVIEGNLSAPMPVAQFVQQPVVLAQPIQLASLQQFAQIPTATSPTRGATRPASPPRSPRGLIQAVPQSSAIRLPSPPRINPPMSPQNLPTVVTQQQLGGSQLLGLAPLPNLLNL